MARPDRGGVAAILVVFGLLCAGVWALIDVRINVATLIDSAHNAVAFAGRMLPLDFPPVSEVLGLCGTTLAIVISATLVSVVISAPLALLAAANTTPWPILRPVSRAVVVAARAVPDVILAIVFFRIFGLGGMTGVLAMGLHSVGMIGKLYADAVEDIDEGTRLAVRATGAARGQELLVGVLPQVAPAFIATALHRLDINLRVSVLLGFVGVNGLGYAIATALRSLDYRRGMALALVVLALCLVIELISGAARTALLRSPSHSRAGHPPGRPGELSPGWSPGRLGRHLVVGVTTLVVLASLYGADVSPLRFVEGLGNLGTTARLFWPPSSGGMGPTLLTDLATTVTIALAATTLGVLVALPLGVAAARTVSPRSAPAFRILLVMVRGIPELILGVVFVVITGLGAVAGTLALTVGAIGFLGKLVADSIEEVDQRVEQAVRATGAGRWQTFCAATLPQAAPAVLAHVLHQLDTNIRAATLLGIVGAGGIGFDLLSASRILSFDLVTTILLMIFGTVLLVELLAVWLRRIID